MLLMSRPALAMDYLVEGADAGNFGKPTSIEPVTVIGTPAGIDDNLNRSKDSAYIPPPFGSPSSNTPGTGELVKRILAFSSL